MVRQSLHSSAGSERRSTKPEVGGSSPSAETMEHRRRTGNIRRSAKDRRYCPRPTDEERREQVRRDLEERRKDPKARPAPEASLVKKVLVTGDREWDDIPRTVEALQVYAPGTILVHGACRGADIVCAAIGEALGFVVHAYPADWAQYPRAAGVIRNQQMLTEEHRADEPIDVCLAFHNRIEDSKGTADMVYRADKAHVPVVIITSHPRSSTE